MKLDTVFFGLDNIADFLIKLCPPLSLVCIVTSSKVQEVTNRFCEKKLHALGYRIFVHLTDKQNLFTVPYETALILASGGNEEFEYAKTLSQKHSIKLAFIQTNIEYINYSNTSVLIINTRYEKGDSPLFRTLCNLPSLFGGLTAKLCAVFDYKFSHIMQGKKYCAETVEAAYKIIDDTITLAGQGMDANMLIENVIKFNALLDFNSGAYCASKTLEHLYNFEKTKTKSSGENEFLFSLIVSKVYRQFLMNDLPDFIPPPNNLERLEKMCEFLGFNEHRAIKNLRPILSSEQLKFYNYRFNEYKDDFLVEVNSNLIKLNTAFKYFKRLYDDDGYSLINYLDPSAVNLSLNLAPDVIESDLTLLSYLKDLGVLDL